MTDTAVDLIARLEEAAAGNRGLDAQVEVLNRGLYAASIGLTEDQAAQWRWRANGTVSDDHTSYDAPRYTTSIDAALTLVPEGLGWQVQGDPKATKYAGEACIEHPKDGWHFPTESNGRTPALALCIAALRARLPDRSE